MYIFDLLREYRKKRYVSNLVSRGLKLGKNVYLNDGFFLDAPHCHLITIEDNVVFGPGVRLFAHDASSLKVIGKTKINFVHLKANCFIGAGVTILPGVTVGENCIIATGSVVTSNVPEGEVWGGVAARKLMSVDEYKRKLLDLPSNDFPQSEYSDFLLNELKINEMRRRIENLGVGFMVNDL